MNAVQPDAIRLAPPLILGDDEAGAFLAALPGILERAGEQAPATGRVPAQVPVVGQAPAAPRAPAAEPAP